VTSVASPDTALIADAATYGRDGVPYDCFARLRASAPVVWVDQPESPFPGLPAKPGDGFWAVLRHAAAEQVLRNPRVYSSYAGGTQIFDAPFPPVLAELRRAMINMDPPEHSRLRGLLTKAFTPRAISRLVEGIQRRASSLVEAASGRDTVDFAREVAAELPLLTLADMLGVPESDRWLMFDWSNRVIGFQDAEYSTSSAFDPADASDMARVALAHRPVPDANGKVPDARTRAGMADLYAYAHELGEYKRAHPADDIMSVLMQQVDADGGRVDVAEFENLFWLFSIAGNETVRNALPGGLSALIQHPDQYQLLRQRPELLPGAVEEMLRWWPPVVHFRRTATEDTDLHGAQVRAGQKVVVFFVSANRDETVFDDPDRFDITRSPNPHLAFGHGPHFCIAAQLAREQMKAMFSAVTTRWASVEPAGEPERLRSNFQNGIKHLPIRFTLA
jgi:cytochrome P450